MNSHLSEPFSILRSIRQGCPFSSHLYVLTLKQLLWKLEALRGVSRDLECGKSVAAYAGDVTVIVSSHNHIDLIGRTLQEYKAVIAAKIDPEMSVSLQLSTWRGKHMLFNSVLELWTDGSVKFLGVWFGLDF